MWSALDATRSSKHSADPAPTTVHSPRAAASLSSLVETPSFRWTRPTRGAHANRLHADALLYGAAAFDGSVGGRRSEEEEEAAEAAAA